MLLTLEQIVRYLREFGIYVDPIYMSMFEESALFILGNILFIIFILFWLILLWKIFSRVVNSLF